MAAKFKIGDRARVAYGAKADMYRRIGQIVHITGRHRRGRHLVYQIGQHPSHPWYREYYWSWQLDKYHGPRPLGRRPKYTRRADTNLADALASIRRQLDIISETGIVGP